MKYKQTNIIGDKVYGKKRLKFKKINNILEKKNSRIERSNATCWDIRFCSFKK